MFEQVNLFEGFIPYYKITKPIRLIELFAGIGSQHQALKNLGVKIDRSTIVEWSVFSIQAYNDIHIRKYDDWTDGMSKEQIATKLSEYGVSLNYNEPASLKTLLRKDIEWLKNVYNNIININNKVNIMSVKASDLEITDLDKYEYIMTYSFPCQDLSKAGKGKGMSDTNTRSGLLWEVERILSECKDLPQILLMENVPDVIGSRYIQDFKRWESRLRELGYSNFIEILNAKDYGIPQSRERAFMVSIKGEYLYKFPRKMELKLKLKDLLEENVDEKYYLSEKFLACMTKENTGAYPRRERFIQNLGRNNQDVANTITTLAGSRDTDNFVGNTKEYANYLSWEDQKGRINTQDHRAYFDEKVSGTIPAMDRGIPNVILNSKELNLKTQLANDLITNGVVQGGEIINHSYTSSESRPDLKDYIESDNGIVPTLTTRPDVLGYVEFKSKDKRLPEMIEKIDFTNDQPQSLDLYNRSVSPISQTLTLPNHNSQAIVDKLRIRKLTPRECYRLMGFSDEAFNRAQEHQSNSSLYHQAGDSIVVNVLENILKGLL